MDKPAEIKWMKVPSNYVEGLDSWVIRLENAIPLQDELQLVINECKNFYGNKFNEFFIEEALDQATENFYDIYQWEMMNQN